MRHHRRRSVWLGLVLAICSYAMMADEARPQDAPEVTPEAVDIKSDSAAEASAPVEESLSGKTATPLPFEVLPQIFHVRDGEGKLQAIPGIGYEQLMQLWKQQHQLAEANRKPPFAIESLEFSGTVTGSNAELIARFMIMIHDEGWVCVPLRLDGAVLREPPTYDGPGEQVLELDPSGGGLVSWIRGQVDESHELVLKLVAKVEEVGPQSRLQLDVPLAAVSQMQLQVPLPQAVASVSEGSTLDSVRPLAGNKTEIKVLGLANAFELTWHPAETKVAGLPAILEASSDQLVRINGRSANTYAELTVRSLGSEFDHFQVRLPPGADYIGTPENGVTLVAVDASAPSGKLYDVRLPKKALGPVKVQLVTERAHDASQDDSPLELAGFEVIGAVRQWGTIAVQVEGDWQVVWGESSYVRSVDDVGGNRRDELAAGFEYFVQPYSLSARVIPQTTRIRVEPQYTVLVGSDDVRLDARLKYVIRGAKVRSLTIDVGDWEVDAIEPASLVNIDAALANVDRQLTIPLLQATSGEVEIRLAARQRLEPGAETLRLELPRPQKETLPADVAIVSDDPIEVLPRLEETVGLVPQLTRPEMQLPERQQQPLFYRTTGDESVLVADRRVHAQAISTGIASRLEIGEDETRVTETFNFRVAYQPTDHFTLIVPPGLSPQRLTVLHDGARIMPVALRERTATENAATPVRINLPAPVIGRCQLKVSYTRPHAKPPTQASALVTVPLVVPGEGQLQENQMQVVAAAGLSANYPQGAWTREGRPAEGDALAEFTLSAPRALPEVTLAISSQQDPAEAATTVERALIETHLTGSARLDRALFRVATMRSRIEVLLPDGADSRSLAVLVDGVLVAPDSTRQRTIVVPLEGTDGDHLVELRYRFGRRDRQGSLEFDCPQISAARWVQQCYWEVIMPSDEHLLASPADYTDESTWAWSSWGWQREPTLSPVALADWIRENTGVAVPAAETAAGKKQAASGNRYLFSAVGQIEPLRIYTLSRSRLVLLASLPLLVLGLALIYFPRMRHPALLLLAAVGLASLSAMVPHLALLLAQAAVLGLVLVGVAALLVRWLPQGPSTTPSTSRGSSYAVLERSVTELYHRSPSKSHPPSTATNPLVPASPDVD